MKIIGGMWKGRTILVPLVHSIRPTTSFVRETLFNWLDPVIHNAMCLDCFFGSGALGLEALSRGARKVTFIDHNVICIKTLTKTLQNFGAYGNEIIHSDCCIWLKRCLRNNFYNLVFLDPPFHKEILCAVITLLEESNCLMDECYIYVETASKNYVLDAYFDVLPVFWFLYKRKSTRRVTYSLYFRKYNQ